MTTWGDKLQGISKAKLERLATAEFAPKTIYAACEERAALGFSWAEIRPSIPVNVQNTAAVKTLLAALAKEKLCIEWIPIRDKPDSPYLALHISWEKPIK